MFVSFVIYLETDSSLIWTVCSYRSLLAYVYGEFMGLYLLNYSRLFLTLEYISSVLFEASFSPLLAVSNYPCVILKLCCKSLLFKFSSLMSPSFFFLLASNYCFKVFNYSSFESLRITERLALAKFSASSF